MAIKRIKKKDIEWQRYGNEDLFVATYRGKVVKLHQHKELACELTRLIHRREQQMYAEYRRSTPEPMSFEDYIEQCKETLPSHDPYATYKVEAPDTPTIDAQAELVANMFAEVEAIQDAERPARNAHDYPALVAWTDAKHWLVDTKPGSVPVMPVAMDEVTKKLLRRMFSFK